MAKKKRQNIRICEVMQNANFLTEEQILKGLDRPCIEKYAYILHDKDIDEKGSLKAAHWHIMLKFKDSTAMEDVAKWFDVELQYVEKSKSGRFDYMVLYLIHHRNPEKYQYSADEVKANFNYQKFLDNRNSSLPLEEIIALIEDGTIKRHNYTNYISCETFTKYKSQIDNAFKYVDDKNQSANHSKDVVFISGASSSGKTYFAKKYAAERNMSIYFNDAGKDSAGGYRDEDIFVLDDFRFGDIPFNELLKMLDNNTCTKVASRYYNKSIAACKVVIITSVFSPAKMFGRYCMENNDDIYQLKRRCRTWLDMDKDTIRLYEIDEIKRDYVLTGEFENPIKDAEFNNNEDNSFVNDLKGTLISKAPPVQTPPAQAEGVASKDTDTGNYI